MPLRSPAPEQEHHSPGVQVRDLVNGYDGSFLDGALVKAVNDASDAVNIASDVATTAGAIVVEACRLIPGVDHAGISVASRRGRLKRTASTDELARRLGELQHSLREGPCVSVMEQEGTVVVENARYEQRWPAYVPQAVRLGVRSQMGIRLFDNRHGIAALNLYSSSRDLEPHLCHLAELFAKHASHALDRARHTEQLQSALANRGVIGQAIGILMERYQIDEDRAFDFLVRRSTTGNVKLRSVAQEIVDEVTRKEPSRDRGTSAAD